MPSHHLSPGKGERERERRDDYTKNSFFFLKKTRPQRRTKLLTINELQEDPLYTKKKKPFIQSPSNRLVTNKAAKYQNNNDTTHSY
jgi:hypothetical protein